MTTPPDQGRERCIHAFSSVVDIPTWILLDPTNHTRSTVRRRRHLIWWLLVKEQIPVSEIAARFGMSRTTVWRAQGHHRAKTRDDYACANCGCKTPHLVVDSVGRSLSEIPCWSCGSSSLQRVQSSWAAECARVETAIQDRWTS